MPETLTKADKADFRMSCVIEATKIKNHPMTKEDRSVLDIAKELSDFVIGE